MKPWMVAWLAACSLVCGQEAVEDLTKVPPADSAIPSPVKALAHPAEAVFPGGFQMAVNTSSEKAQASVNQGLNHLHGGWEFEASRYFAAALVEDPECLMAHWGMVMCLLNPSPENDPARKAAVLRMLKLVEGGKGNDLERGLSYGLIKYLEDGPQAAANAFRKVAEKYPNDLQSPILAAMFTRTGYDEFGDPTAGQETAEEMLTGLIAKHPESPVPLNALLVIRAEAPDLSPWVADARKLVALAPDYPPYLHLLGHYEWRVGEHPAAVAAFAHAVKGFEEWMHAGQIQVADAPDWVRSANYQAVALSSAGKTEEALKLAKKFSNLPFPENRAGSAGARMLLWEAETLPARILMRRSNGNMVEALASLPKPTDLRLTTQKSLATLWIDGLRIALDARRLLDAKNLELGRKTADALPLHGELMSKMQDLASKGGERSQWLRGFRTLEVLAGELRGRLALAGVGATRNGAPHWFKVAADRETYSTMLLPPPLLFPMDARTGEAFLILDKPAEAVEAFNRGLVKFPNDLETLKGLQKAQELAKLTADAKATEAKIKALQAK